MGEIVRIKCIIIAIDIPLENEKWDKEFRLTTNQMQMIFGKVGETPLNEHGFGMKHALASANPDNDAWEISTRTVDDYKSQKYKRVEAPYEIEGFGASLIESKDENWPGELNSSGTYVTFKCSWDLFYTIRKGISGKLSPFGSLVEILAEDLGFIYSGVIQEGMKSLKRKI